MLQLMGKIQISAFLAHHSNPGQFCRYEGHDEFKTNEMFTLSAYGIFNYF